MFDIFGRKKKIKANNEQNKNRMLQTIDGILGTVFDPELVSLLSDAKKKIESQPISPRKEIEATDAAILGILDKIKACVADKNFSKAILIVKAEKGLNRKLDERAGISADRQAEAHRTAAETFSDEDFFTEEELAKCYLDGLVEKQKKCMAEAEEVKKKLARDPNNVSLKYQLQHLGDAYSMAKKQASFYSESSRRDYLAKMLATLNKEARNQIANREIDDEMLQTIQSEYQKVEQMEKELQSTNDSLTGMLHGTSSASQSDECVFAETEDVFSTAQGSVLSAEEQDLFSVSSGAGKNHMKKILDHIDETVDALVDAQNEAEKSMDRESAQLQRCNEELKKLLLQRKDASAAECVVLDGKIDALRVKQNSVKFNIKRFRQTIAEIAENLSMVRKVQNARDIEDIRSLAPGEIGNTEDIAMWLKGVIENANENVGRAGTANAVVDDTEIEMRPISAMEESHAEDFAEVKDEDKYAALERELGID